MSYDKKGLGVAEMTFISVNYPDIWTEIEKAFDDGKDDLGLEIARQAIEVINQKLI